MERSIALVADHLRALAGSVARGEPLAAQVALAREAEGHLAARLGTNTHKGALFLGGLLVVARARVASDEPAELRAAIATVAREVAVTAPPRATHGEAARRRLGIGGILGEAAAGLPSVFDAALPAYRAATAAGGDPTSGAFAMLAALMQTVEDTTAVHRCGAAGLGRLRADGARLASLVVRGEHLPFLRERNAAYRALNLTMGGVADLLGVALAMLLYRGELPPP